MPSADEWYKAAYHDPVNPLADAGGTTDFWLYPMQRDTAPIPAIATAIGDIANPPATNYDSQAVWTADFAEVHVTTVGSGGGGNQSHYGAADMGGNVSEWTETFVAGEFMDYVEVRGSDWLISAAAMAAHSVDMGSLAGPMETAGFRLARTVAGGTNPPVITSASHATGTVGEAFFYQITATGMATSYAAAGLPGGLSIDTLSGAITGIPTTAGGFAVSISASNANGTDNRTLIVTVQSAGLSGYEVWRGVHFSGPGEMDPGISGPDVDFDRDGLCNFVEYSLARDPRVGDGPGIFACTVTEGGQSYLAITYTRTIPAADAEITVEVGTDLADWDSGAAHLTETNRVDNCDGSETVTTRSNIPMVPGGRGFLRLRIENVLP